MSEHHHGEDRDEDRDEDREGWPGWAGVLSAEIAVAYADLVHRLQRLEFHLMSDANALHEDVVALQQAVSDASGRVSAEIADLEAKIAAGQTISAADLQGIKDATTAIAGIGAAPAPADVPPAPPADVPPAPPADVPPPA